MTASAESTTVTAPDVPSTVVDDEAIVRVVSRGERPRAAGALAASRVFAWRATVKIKTVHDQLGNTVIFPLVLTLVFTYLLGGAIAGSPHQYLQFFLPGVLVITVIGTSMSTALTLSRDISTGVFDRIRSLPVWQPSVLVGAMLGDVVRYFLASVVPLVVGFIIGFRPHGGVVGVVLGLLFLQLFTFCLAWMWTLFAVAIKDSAAVTGVIYLLQFIIMFGSNFMVPSATMPSWLQTVVTINPVTHAVTVIRGLMLGNASAGDIAGGFIACAALLVLFAPPTMLLYSRKQR